MEFKISSSVLNQQLQILSRVINSRNSIPILDCFLFNVCDNLLTITSSDGDIFVESTCIVESNGDMKFAVTAKTITEAIKEIKNQDIVFSVNKNNEFHDNIVISYNNGKYDIMSRLTNDYHIVPKENSNLSSFSIKSNELLNYISSTIFAASLDELRPIIGGIYFNIQDDLDIVATDCHNLILINSNTPGDLVAIDNNKSFVLPFKMANMLRNMLSNSDETVYIEFSFKRIYLTFLNYSISCKLIEGNYPNYKGIIPKNNPSKININRLDLISTIKRISLFSESNLIKLLFGDNKLIVSSKNYNYSTSAEELVECEYDSNNIEIGFNSTNLLSSLNNLTSEQISFELLDSSHSCILKNIPEDNRLILMMPMMLNS